MCEGEDLTLEAQREDIPYGENGNVSVIMPIRGCKTCGMHWTDEYGEVIRDFAVTEAMKEKK